MNIDFFLKDKTLFSQRVNELSESLAIFFSELLGEDIFDGEKNFSFPQWELPAIRESVGFPLDRDPKLTENLCQKLSDEFIIFCKLVEKLDKSSNGNKDKLAEEVDQKIRTLKHLLWAIRYNGERTSLTEIPSKIAPILLRSEEFLKLQEKHAK